MMDTAIVDYGLCNLDSIRRAVEECGGRPTVTDDPRDLERAERIILPGVGAFPDAMRNLRERRLDQALAERVLGRGVPFLGICLGMQLMARKSYEGGETEGLGWIDGEVRRLEPAHRDERIPHVGWNEIEPVSEAGLFDGISPGTDFYFVHTYHLDCANPDEVAGYTPYCGSFASAVVRESCFGVQFHPEKSQKAGFRLLANFLRV